MYDWKEQRAHTIRARQDLPVSFSLHKNEEAFFTAEGQPEFHFGFAVTPYYFSLIGESPEDPLRAQCIPRKDEFEVKEYEVQDPLWEEPYSPLPRMVHRYPNRVLLLVTDECALYCRHCFRRYFASRRGGVISPGQLRKIGEYLRLHTEVQEVVLSGGDPLVLGDARISELLHILRYEVGRTLVLRLASRMPVVMPQRITPQLTKILSEHSPLFLITQFNHWREITPASRTAISGLVDAGVPVLNQAVLLKGVNDRADTLAALFQGLLEIRVKPYYLFQGDLAAGTSHFRVPLAEGFRLLRKLRGQISGLAMPVYAVDLPEGGGKIPLTEQYIEKLEEGWYVFIGPDGKRYYYPEEAR
ncbi:MAG: KamA family radical SAM protein [Spirochaetia bacterium]|nr:KamA family radical SAM protein [Spirochaetia bacterium]